MGLKIEAEEETLADQEKCMTQLVQNVDKKQKFLSSQMVKDQFTVETVSKKEETKLIRQFNILNIIFSTLAIAFLKSSQLLYL